MYCKRITLKKLSNLDMITELLNQSTKTVLKHYHTDIKPMS